MGLVDVFKEEDKIDLTISQVMTMIKENALLNAKNEVMLAGYKKGINHTVVLALLNEENKEVEEKTDGKNKN